MGKNWLQHYQQGVPHTIDPARYASLTHLLNEACQRYADHDAFTHLNTSITYQMLFNQSQALAVFLQDTLKLQKGDRLALMLPNILHYPIAMYAGLMLGLTIVNVNPLYTPDELTYQLNDSGASALIVLDLFSEAVAQSLPDVNLPHIIVAKVGDCFPTTQRWLTNSVATFMHWNRKKGDIPHAHAFDKALEQGKDGRVREVSIDPESVAFLQYTGGTTGRAKAAMLTHRNLVANLLQITAWIEPIMNRGKEIIITALPLYHIFSLTANALTFMHLGANNVLIADPRDIRGMVQYMKSVPFTVMTGVNTLFNALLRAPAFRALDFSSFKLAIAGGMALQPSVAQEWQAVTNSPLLEAYGLTETSPAVTINPVYLSEYNGRAGLPIPSTEVYIIDEQEELLPVGEAGELCVKGPQVMLGYWQQPEETKVAFTKQGWFKTGDIAVLDEQGYVCIVDRKKDMINVSGFKVFPNEVEAVIGAHPGVKEVGVKGVLDRKGRESVQAYVVKADPALNKQSLLEYCYQHLTAYKIPQRILFVETLPKSPVGKVLRKNLEPQK